MIRKFEQEVDQLQDAINRGQSTIESFMTMPNFPGFTMDSGYGIPSPIAPNPFDTAERILLNPNFSKRSPAEIQDLYRGILASGLTKQDIQDILRRRR
jgi:hypothetical protein